MPRSGAPEERFTEVESKLYEALVAGDLATFNERMAREGMAGVTAGR